MSAGKRVIGPITLGCELYLRGTVASEAAVTAVYDALRRRAKKLRARLKELRGKERRPTDPCKLKEFEEKLPLYRKLKVWLRSD